MTLRPFKPRALMITGLWLIVSRSVIESWFDRAGYATDLSDFAFGALFGIGLALTLMGMWRHRQGHGESNHCGMR